jgi:hypothetical protein
VASSIGCFGLVLDPRLQGLGEMSLDVGVVGLPGLQIQIDFHASLPVVGVRNLDDDGVVTVRMSLAFGAPEELE